MKSETNIARIIGILIIVAYGVVGSFALESDPLVIGLEIISGLAVLGAAVLLYPILKPHSKKLTTGYTIIKIFEGLFIIFGALTLLSSSTQASSFREWLSGANVYLFGVRFSILAIIFYQSRLVPRFISVWGLIASIMIMGSFFINTVIDVTISPAISHLPVISNELFLALWLIVKGFN